MRILRLENSSSARGGEGEAGLGELAARDVDRDAEVRQVARLLPARRQRGRLGDDPRADRPDQPVLLGERDETVGRDVPALGMPPAQQRLHREHAPAPADDDLPMAILCLTAVLLGAVVWPWRRRTLPDWMAHGLVATGTVIVGAGIALSGLTHNTAAFFFLWVTPYATT